MLRIELRILKRSLKRYISLHAFLHRSFLHSHSSPCPFLHIFFPLFSSSSSLPKSLLPRYLQCIQLKNIIQNPGVDERNKRDIDQQQEEEKSFDKVEEKLKQKVELYKQMGIRSLYYLSSGPFLLFFQ